MRKSLHSVLVPIAFLMATSTFTGINIASAAQVYGEYAGTNPRFVIAMTDDRYSAIPGEMITYRISMTNESLVGVANVRLTATLPRELIPASASDGGFFLGQFAQWNGLGFTPGENKIVTLSATVPVSIRNAAVIITTSQIEGGPAAQDTTIVQRTGMGKGSGLSIAKTPETVEPGGTVNYAITVTNNDAETKTIEVRATFDRNLTYVTASDQGHSRGLTQAVWGELFIGANASATVNLTLRASQVAKPGEALQLNVEANSARASDTTVVDGSAPHVVAVAVNQNPIVQSTYGTFGLPAPADPAMSDARLLGQTNSVLQESIENQLLPQTGIEDYTGSVENLRAFLHPMSAGNSGNGAGVILVILALGAFSAGGFAARKYFTLS